MKLIIVGLGVQGKKRRSSVGEDFVAYVDPENSEADYRQIYDVPLSDFDAALLCVPDEPKIELLTYLLKNGKHALVEKPLWAEDEVQISQLESIAKENNAFCYTAYNHRFEPHFVRMRDVIQSRELGRLYHCRLFYGNGTAGLVRDSAWRDQGAGVLPDLGSHLLDLMDFWFSHRDENYEINTARCFENKSCDHVTLINSNTAPQLELEMTVLSWRNDFSCDIFAEKGSAHIRSLCKWGPSQFILRKRILPSGRPTETSQTLVQPDPTWALEYAYFKKQVSEGAPTDLSKDKWINRQIKQLSVVALEEAAHV